MSTGVAISPGTFEHDDARLAPVHVYHAHHVLSGLGWVGAALAFLALAVIGFTTDDPVKARGAYLLMAPAAWAWIYVVGAVALAFALLIVILHLTGASPTHH
jgi:hypothetical protein